MSMSHKAYLFDIAPFRAELEEVLNQCLAEDDPSKLITFIDSELQAFTDPYEGEPLQTGWIGSVANHDTQPIADYALTKLYNVNDDRGVGDGWLSVDASLPERDRPALLGRPFGPAQNRFDPGKLGAYLQDAAAARVSLNALANHRLKNLEPFLDLLAEAADRQQGVYVTF